MMLIFAHHVVLMLAANAPQNWSGHRMLLDHLFGSANHAMAALDFQTVGSVKVFKTS